MNQRDPRISLAVLAMFVLLLLNINYVQAFKGDSLAQQALNNRASSTEQFSYQRGADRGQRRRHRSQDRLLEADGQRQYLPRSTRRARSTRR